MKKAASWFILAAGVLWGGMGVFVKILTGAGLSSVTVTSVRLFSAGVLLFLYLLLFEREKLRLPKKALFWVLVTALFSVLAMSSLYFIAIDLTSLAVAAILLYTAPVFVAVMSALFFKERFTGRKTLALAFAVAGCVLVAGLGGKFTPLGVLAGLGSGFAYALYSVFGKFMLRHVHPFTATAYTFLFAGLFSLLLADIPSVLTLFKEGGAKPITAALTVGLVTAAIPYLLYTWGLRYTEAGKASILATAEPLVATLFGILLYHEELTVPKTLGILLIAGAIVLLNTGKAQTNDAPEAEL